MKEAVYQVYPENYGSSRGQWIIRTSVPLLLVQLVWKKYFRYVHMVAESDRILSCILNNCINLHDCRQLHFLQWQLKWCISLASLNKAMQSQLFTLVMHPLLECIGYFFSVTYIYYIYLLELSFLWTSMGATSLSWRLPAFFFNQIELFCVLFFSHLMVYCNE